MFANLENLMSSMEIEENDDVTKNFLQIQLQKQQSFQEKISKSMFKQPFSLYQRWKNNDNIFKGKYKTGVTPQQNKYLHQNQKKFEAKLFTQQNNNENEIYYHNKLENQFQIIELNYTHQSNNMLKQNEISQVNKNNFIGNNNGKENNFSTPKKNYNNQKIDSCLRTPTPKNKDSNDIINRQLKFDEKFKSPLRKVKKNNYSYQSTMSTKKVNSIFGLVDINRLDNEQEMIDNFSTPPHKHIQHKIANTHVKFDLNLDLNETPQKRKKIKSNEYDTYFSQISIFNNHYNILNTIGRGHFGNVYRCKNKFDQLQYAIKISKNKINSRNDNALNEVQALASIDTIADSPHVIRYYKAWIEGGKLYLLMELCEQSLNQIIQCNSQNKKFFEEKQIRQVLHDIASALFSIHSQKIVHLDIKPENILYSKGLYKIADLGLSRICSRDYGDDILEGDARYLAKELLNDISQGQEIPDLSKADIFSLGATIYQMLLQEELPQNGEEWHEIRQGIFKKEKQITQKYSHFLFDLVKKMMHIDYKMRPSAKEILDLDVIHSKNYAEYKWEKINQQLLLEQIESCKKALCFQTRIKRRKNSFQQ